MSVSPAQNFSKPPPVPEVPTATRTSGLSALNCSAIASVSAPTVLEPSAEIAALPAHEIAERYSVDVNAKTLKPLGAAEASRPARRRRQET